MVDPITLLVLTHYQTFEEDPRTLSLVIHFCGEGAGRTVVGTGVQKVADEHGQVAIF